MTEPGRDERTERSPDAGTGGSPGSRSASRHHADPEAGDNSNDRVGREMFACPHCGHQLSMFREARSSPGDKAAAWVASVAGSWPFLLILVVAILAWFVVNTILPLFYPHPTAMLDYLGTALAIVAALQGPLILLTQRRESDRDRARDIETFHISQNTEADLHSISHAINSVLEQWNATGRQVPLTHREVAVRLRNRGREPLDRRTHRDLRDWRVQSRLGAR